MVKFFLPLVIFCNEQLEKQIRNIQQELFELTGSRNCLDNWTPHITIGNGVEVDDETEDVEKLINEIHEVIKDFSPMKVTACNYGFLEHEHLKKLGLSPFVVHLDIKKTPELDRLACLIKEKITDKRHTVYKQPWPYDPHLTVAFGDLTKEGFEKAKKALSQKKFSSELFIDHIALTKEDDKGKWKEYKRISFEK